MAIDQEELVLRARSALTSDDEAAKLPREDFYAVIPLAVSEWIRRNKAENLASGGRARRFFLETPDIPISAGVADVQAVIEPLGIMPDKVKRADIYISYGVSPQMKVNFVNSRDRLRLPGIQDAFYLNAYFDGKNMYFADVAGNPLNSVDFKFTAERELTDLSQFPDDLLGEVSLILADLMRRFSTDGEHKGITRRTAQK